MGFSYKIEEKLGILSERKGRQFGAEVNMISYNGQRPKLDIRRWDKNNQDDTENGNGTMHKGISLDWEETQKLLEILQDLTGADFR